MQKIFIILILLFPIHCYALLEYYQENILYAAIKLKVDPVLLTAIAHTETNFHNVKSSLGGTAEGIFQFNDLTWEHLLNEHALELGLPKSISKYSPYASALMAALYVRENTQSLEQFLNRSPTPTEIYLAHLLGPTGAKLLLASNETLTVDQILPAAVNSNKVLFTDSTGHCLTVALFKQQLTNKFNHTLALYENIPKRLEDLSAYHTLE